MRISPLRATFAVILAIAAGGALPGCVTHDDGADPVCDCGYGSDTGDTADSADTADTGGDTSDTGGDTSDTGGDTSDTGVVP